MAVHFLIQVVLLLSRSFCASSEVTSSCHVHLSPQGQLILTSVSGLLVLYLPVIFLSPLNVPFLKISFFPSDVSPVISLILSRILLVHEFSGFPYFLCEKTRPFSVLPNQFP